MNATERRRRDDPRPERDEAALLREARRGDAAAFGALVERHQETLHRFIRYHVTDARDADDVLQTSLLKAYRALPTARADLAFLPWLRCIAANAARDLLRYRRRHRRESWEAVDQETLGSHDRADDPEACALAREGHGRIAELLASLPARERRALVLFAVEERRCREIGELLGVSTATAKRLVARGRLLFRHLHARAPGEHHEAAA